MTERPEHVVVVGAGMVGLSAAWFLQAEGVRVTVVDRDGIAAGSSRTDEWVGSRPCTADGLPLVGRTRSSRVFVSGGHGMWGIALGPLSGKLLAAQVVRGGTSSLPSSFDPLR